MLLLSIPDRTPYDLQFRLLGFPVRIHPLFWLGSVVLGWNVGDWPERVLWVGCVLVSILLHELGHAVAARATGQRPAIVLHIMGGLCVYESGRQSTAQRLVTLICGPGAGLATAVVVLIVGYATYGLTLGNYLALLGLPGGTVMPNLLETPRVEILIFLFYINFLWSLLNLLPVIPLDGGQIALVGLNAYDRRRGVRWAYNLSVVTAGLLVLYALYHRDWFRAMFFAYFAGYSIQQLQLLRENPYAVEDDSGSADWWKG